MKHWPQTQFLDLPPEHVRQHSPRPAVAAPSSQVLQPEPLRVLLNSSLPVLQIPWAPPAKYNQTPDASTVPTLLSATTFCHLDLSRSLPIGSLLPPLPTQSVLNTVARGSLLKSKCDHIPKLLKSFCSLRGAHIVCSMLSYGLLCTLLWPPLPPHCCS